MFKKESMIVIGVIAIIVLVLGFLYRFNSIGADYDFKIYFFAAGKADAILLSKNNHYILIDTGDASLQDDLLQYFQKNHITKLDYLILTHFDKDHIGCASSIIENVDIGEVLESNYPKESSTYDNYVTALSEKNLVPITVEKEYSISFQGVDILINGPDGIYEKNESNNSSLIVSIQYENQNFLLMGDAENARIKDYLINHSGTYNFIKIPYHGYYLKQLKNLLESTTPQYAVLTCSLTDGCESDTLDILDTYQVKYYMTKSGSISVYSNGDKLIIKQ